MSIKPLIIQLRNLLKEPLRLPTEIPKLQEQIWSASDSTDEDGKWEILRDLAYDLEYYQPNPKVRTEDKAFYGEERAIEEISQALTKLEQ